MKPNENIIIKRMVNGIKVLDDYVIVICYTQRVLGPETIKMLTGRMSCTTWNRILERRKTSWINTPGLSSSSQSDTSNTLPRAEAETGNRRHLARPLTGAKCIPHTKNAKIRKGMNTNQSLFAPLGVLGVRQITDAWNLTGLASSSNCIRPGS